MAKPEKSGSCGKYRSDAPGCIKRCPSSASISPAAIFSKVDFPEPLRPTRQIRAPGATERSAPSSSGLPPSVSITPWRLRRGGAIGYYPEIMCEGSAADAAKARDGGRRSVIATCCTMVLQRFLAFFGVGRNDEQFAITHAAFGDQMPSEMLDFMTRSPQQRDLKTRMRIEMHMQR